MQRRFIAVVYKFVFKILTFVARTWSLVFWYYINVSYLTWYILKVCSFIFSGSVYISCMIYGLCFMDLTVDHQRLCKVVLYCHVTNLFIMCCVTCIILFPYYLYGVKHRGVKKDRQGGRPSQLDQHQYPEVIQFLHPETMKGKSDAGGIWTQNVLEWELYRIYFMNK